MMSSGVDAVFHRPIWQVVWEVTHDCNLACSYCLIEKEKDAKPSYEKALKAITQLEPKILVLTGGEPTILPNIALLLQQIRERMPDTNLFLNTNGVNIDSLVPSVNLLDGVLFSLDGRGEVNRTVRGVRGERMIENLKMLQRAMRGARKTQLLQVMTVVTRTNFPFLREFLEEIEKTGDGIQVIMKPRLPYTHPDSIASTPEGLESYFQFWEKNKAHFNFWVYGLFSPEQFHSPAICYAQFFFSRVDNRENLFFCNLYERQCIGKGSRVIPRPCPQPCDCKEYIDEILFGKSLDVLSPNARLVLEMLSQEDLQSAEEFIQTYIDPDYRMELLKIHRF